jgi:putative acetyltransferase
MRQGWGAKIDGVGTYPALIVSREQPNEPPAIRGIDEATFNRPDEADLVDGLRNDGAVLLSLVAELEKRVVGHILFSRMWLDGDGGAIRAAALTPVAVLPDHQRPGVREQLIRTGLDRGPCLPESLIAVFRHRDDT